MIHGNYQGYNQEKGNLRATFASPHHDIDRSTSVGECCSLQQKRPEILMFKSINVEVKVQIHAELLF
jgi:hypothetical protein